MLETSFRSSGRGRRAISIEKFGLPTLKRLHTMGQKLEGKSIYIYGPVGDYVEHAATSLLQQDVIHQNITLASWTICNEQGRSCYSYWSTREEPIFGNMVFHHNISRQIGAIENYIPYYNNDG